MKKISNLLITFALLMMFIPGKVNATGTAGSKFDPNNLNACVKDGTCILLCGYNSEATEDLGKPTTSVEVYYTNQDSWIVDFKAASTPYTATSIKKDGSPIYVAENVAKLFQAGSCPPFAFYETNAGNEVCFTQVKNGCAANDDDWKNGGNSELVHNHLDLVVAELKTAVFDKVASYTCDQVLSEENPDTLLSNKVTEALKNKFYGGNAVPNIVKNSARVQSALLSASTTYANKVTQCIEEEKKKIDEDLKSGKIDEATAKQKKADLDKKKSDLTGKLGTVGSRFGILRPNINVVVKIDPNGCSIISSDLQEWLQWLLDTIRIGGLVLTVVLGVADYAKASFASKEDAMKEANKNFSTRLIALALLLLVPAIVEVALTILNVGVTAENPTCGIN